LCQAESSRIKPDQIGDAPDGRWDGPFFEIFCVILLLPWLPRSLNKQEFLPRDPDAVPTGETVTVCQTPAKGVFQRQH